MGTFLGQKNWILPPVPLTLDHLESARCHPSPVRSSASSSDSLRPLLSPSGHTSLRPLETSSPSSALAEVAAYSPHLCPSSMCSSPPPHPPQIPPLPGCPQGCSPQELFPFLSFRRSDIRHLLEPCHLFVLPQTTNSSRTASRSSSSLTTSHRASHTTLVSELN